MGKTKRERKTKQSIDQTTKTRKSNHHILLHPPS